MCTKNQSPRIEKVCTRALPKGGPRAHFFYPRRFYNNRLQPWSILGYKQTSYLLGRFNPKIK